MLFHYSFIDAKNIKSEASKALCDYDPALVFIFYLSLSSPSIAPGLRNPRAVASTISIRDGRVPPWSQLPMPCSGARDPPASEVAWFDKPEWATMSRIYGKSMIMLITCMSMYKHVFSCLSLYFASCLMICNHSYC